MKYRIIDVWTSGTTFEVEFKPGEKATLVSYFCDVQADVDGHQALEKVYFNQKPETAAPQKGDVIEGEITATTNKKGTHHKFKKSSKYMVTCPCGCGHTFDAKENRSDARREPQSPQTPQTTSDTPKTQREPSESVTRQSDEPPASSYDDLSDLPF